MCFHKNAPLPTFKTRNRVSRREIILALFTVVPKVSPVYNLNLLESELRYRITQFQIEEIEKQIEKSRESLDELKRYFSFFRESQIYFLTIAESLREKHGNECPKEIAKLKEEQDRLAKEIVEKIRMIWDR